MAHFRFIFVLLFFCISFNVSAQKYDSIAVIQATEKFVNAFTNFDWATFRNSFTDDATLFYPDWDQRKRVVGRKEIEATWLKLFPEFADTANVKKLVINPKDIFIQVYGNNAIVTFHLGNGVTHLSRRTLVMVKKKKEWKIAHLHASNISPEN